MGAGWREAGTENVFTIYYMYIMLTCTLSYYDNPVKGALLLSQIKEHELSVVTVSYIWVSWPGQTPSSLPKPSLQSHPCTHTQVSSSIRGNFTEVQKKQHCSVLIDIFHGRAINWGQEHLEAGDLFFLSVRTQPTLHPSHRPSDCLMKPIWISGDWCLGHSPRPLKRPGNMPIFGQESSADCGSIFKEISLTFLGAWSFENSLSYSNQFNKNLLSTYSVRYSRSMKGLVRYCSRYLRK